ncbi:MAG: NADH-quinone oxidoreductase subunit C [bacterium]
MSLSLPQGSNLSNQSKSLSPQEIFELLLTLFPEGSLEFQDLTHQPTILVFPDLLREVMLTLRDDHRLAFNCLMCLTGVDRQGLEVVYHLYSMVHHHKITIRVKVGYDDPKIPTVSDIWPTAEWHEREAYDLLGIEFINHPDLRRILCPEDWEGYPLRKDYQPPLWYHGIPVTVNVPGGASTPSIRTES